MLDEKQLFSFGNLSAKFNKREIGEAYNVVEKTRSHSVAGNLSAFAETRIKNSIQGKCHQKYISISLKIDVNK